MTDRLDIELSSLTPEQLEFLLAAVIAKFGALGVALTPDDLKAADPPPGYQGRLEFFFQHGQYHLLRSTVPEPPQ